MIKKYTSFEMLVSIYCNNDGVTIWDRRKLPGYNNKKKINQELKLAKERTVLGCNRRAPTFFYSPRHLCRLSISLARCSGVGSVMVADFTARAEPTPAARSPPYPPHGFLLP